MEIGFGQVCDRDRAAEALLALPAFDPARGIAQCLGDADIVILALGDMQDVIPCKARAADPPAGKAEEIRIRLFAQGLINRDAVQNGLPSVRAK